VQARRLAALTAIVHYASIASAQTYSKDIAPIVYRSCAPCHRPGEAAPFTLLTYRDVKTHAKQIGAVTKSRYMPPWKPSPGRGDFQGDLRLTDSQIQLIEEWVARGAPEGDPRDLPPSPEFVEGWQHGEPDLIIKLDRPYTLAADGSDVFRNFVLRPQIPGGRFVRALEIRPGLSRAVHHANLLIDRERTVRHLDRKDGEPGFAGMDARIETRSFDPESHFLFWKPGTPVLEEPDGMAWELHPNSDLVLNMHLKPTGKPEIIQPSIGLYFTEVAPVKRPMLLQLEHDGGLDIPPGQNDFVVTDRIKLPVDVDVLAVYPHAHYIARDMQAFATLPDGSRRWLIHIRDWDVNWQAVYRYKNAVALPRGAVISMQYTYDNSTANPRNPNQPPARVVSGDRAVDEMAHLWLQVLPRPAGDGDPRMALQKSVMQRRLEKYPGDFVAEFSLGAILQSEEQLDAAIGRYRNALRARPQDAATHNALGSALLAARSAQSAGAEFREAIRFDPEYADAHYNLSRVLLAADQIPEAISHLREVIRIAPGDAPALSDLGAALFSLGQIEPGLGFLREAVRNQPEYFNGRYNLGQALAAAGKPNEAEAELRVALRIKPGDPDTIDALKRIRK
jgi:Flp pilus assembly protein TadD